MDFGKLPVVDHVNFLLPPDPPQNAALLSALPPRIAAPKVYLGATGYNMKPWVGRWYPAGTREKDFLHHYGRQFNTIEHNTTHYRIPDLATVARWREEVPADFRYCPKIPQTISHARDLGLHGREIHLFCTAIRELGQTLGCCFMQLPPHFEPKNLSILDRFLDVFPEDIPLAVEVRHPDFFRDGTGSADYFQLLHTRRVSTVITDVAGRRDVCHLRLTTGCVLIRFVGNGLHPTDYTRVEDWAERLAQWFGQGLQEAYFFCHEPDNLLAPELAAYAAQIFSEKVPGVRGPVPAQAPPQQGTLF
ncbi:MAG: DUF72 domain-containing protein [Lewinellaceae bacterium]|nr:DUF72 domain-containing protein [Lewinellaceae bacterium]